MENNRPPGPAPAALLINLAADHFEHDIDAPIVCDAHDFREKSFSLTSMVTSAPSWRSLRHFYFTARGCDDFGAEMLGDLNRRDADAAAAALDEQPFAGLQSRRRS